LESVPLEPQATVCALFGAEFPPTE
jgi:hypothetical protein